MDLTTHPAFVHIPLALAVLLPPAYLGAWWSIRKNWLEERIWYVLWLGFIIQTSTCGLAYWTGNNSAEFATASTDLIEAHQTFALKFLITWIVIATLMTIFVWLRTLKFRAALKVLILLLLITQLTYGILLGHAGGGIVFGIGSYPNFSNEDVFYA